MKKIVAALAVALVAAVAFAEGGQEYPTRDITNIVVFKAGGGTDLINRAVMAEMAKTLKVNATVSNAASVSGGLADVWAKPHDGYTIAGLSESVVTQPVMGGFDKLMKNWYPFIVGGSPDLVSVTPNSKFKTMKELIEAAKASPESIKAGAGNAGSIHHLNLLALESGTGAKFQFIPYSGSAPAQNAAMTGEIELVITSVAEQQQLIRSGQLRPLGMLVADPFELGGFGKIPTAFADYPNLQKFLPIFQAIGFAVPNDVSDLVKMKLTNAFNAALQAEPVKKWLADNYYTVSGKTGKLAQDEFNRLESMFSWKVWELGAAKVDPATLGIPKP